MPKERESLVSASPLLLYICSLQEDEDPTPELQGVLGVLSGRKLLSK